MLFITREATFVVRNGWCEVCMFALHIALAMFNFFRQNLHWAISHDSGTSTKNFYRSCSSDVWPNRGWVPKYGWDGSFLGTPGLLLLGHDDHRVLATGTSLFDMPDRSYGNLNALLLFRPASSDLTLAKHFESSPRNENNSTHSTQNQIIVKVRTIDASHINGARLLKDVFNFKTLFTAVVSGIILGRYQRVSFFLVA